MFELHFSFLKLNVEIFGAAGVALAYLEVISALLIISVIVEKAQKSAK